MRPWRLRLLGHLALRHHEATVRPPSARTQPLLAIVALTPEGLARSDLAESLFPSTDPAAARRGLSQLLFALRRALPDLPLLTEGELVRWPAETRWVDAEQIRASDPSYDLDTAVAMLEGVQGPLLAGTSPDDVPGASWLRAERPVWDDRVRALARETVRHLVVARRDDDAIALLRGLVTRHPRAESEAVRLAELLAARGDRHDALTVLDRLHVELDAAGLEPEARLTDTRARIAAGNAPSPDPSRVLAPADRPADEVAARARAGDFAEAAQLLREFERDGRHPPAERRLAAAQLAIAREEEHRVEALLAGADPSDPRVHAALAAAARARHDLGAAMSHASAALLATAADERPEDRIDALIELTRTRSRTAEGRRALESADAAVELARAHADAARLTRALLARGIELHRQTRWSEARVALTEARSLATGLGLRVDLATALHHLGTIANLTGALRDALALGEAEVNLRRDLALDRSEAVALTALASTRLKLGESVAALADTQLAVELADGVGDPLARARARLWRAYALHCDPHPHGPEAQARVEEALAITTEELSQPTWVEGAVRLLRGVLRGDAGDPLAGLTDCEEALAIFEAREEPEMLPRVAAARARLLLALDRPSDALASSRHAVQSVLERTAEGDYLAVLYHVHASALRAAGRQAEAERYLSRAWEHLTQLVARAPDGASRSRILSRDPMTRDLVADAQAAGLATDGEAAAAEERPSSATGNVSAIGASGAQRQPLGLADPARIDAHDVERRPARPGWDPASDDAPLAGSRQGVASRRAQLTRILDGAAEAGLRPNIAELARRLGVSTRTIKRDLTALRATRGIDGDAERGQAPPER